MSTYPTVLRVDDGELDRFDDVLKSLGAKVDRLGPDAQGLRTDCSYDLVLTSVRCAPSVPFDVHAGGAGGRPVWIALHDGDPLPIRDSMRGLGVHYLVHAQIQPAVLRLLLLHALYEGTEKRAMPRTLVGSRVTVRVQRTSWSATLLDLALDGCRILSTREVEVGRTVTVVWHTRSGPEPELLLRGRAIRVEREEDGPTGFAHRIAVSFGGIDPVARAHLESIFSGTSTEAAITTLAAQNRNLRDAGPARRGGSREIVLEDVERRARSRVPFSRRVTALIGEASHVMIARDLSLHGIRIEPTHGLPLGAELRLAIYSADQRQPVFVYAQVARDDGEEGLALIFKEVEARMRRRLDRMVKSGPAIQLLTDLDEDTQPVFLAKAVERESEA
ncbi:MAG: PilZ domain-containing protein [Deltaproteobacteria bacterium]|nr:MAG: PilZ domain-containing protein [Deltaproteobacteria bacterium]